MQIQLLQVFGSKPSQKKPQKGHIMSAPQGANSSEEYKLHSRKIIKFLDGTHSCLPSTFLTQVLILTLGRKQPTISVSVIVEVGLLMYSNVFLIRLPKKKKNKPNIKPQNKDF